MGTEKLDCHAAVVAVVPATGPLCPSTAVAALESADQDTVTSNCVGSPAGGAAVGVEVGAALGPGVGRGVALDAGAVVGLGVAVAVGLAVEVALG
ncbi:MAG: hypothetical protein ACYCTZ_13095 [Candidatus Dormibacteria bacterium]